MRTVTKTVGLYTAQHAQRMHCYTVGSKAQNEHKTWRISSEHYIPICWHPEFQIPTEL